MPRIPYKSLTQSDELSEKLEMSTAEIGLSVRTTNCLEEKGIFTVHENCALILSPTCLYQIHLL